MPSKVMEDEMPFAVITAVVELSLEGEKRKEVGEAEGEEGAEEEEETEA